MEQAEQVSKFNKIVEEQLGIESTRVVPEADFIDDLGADSLDIVELVMATEEEFDLEIADEEAEKLKTVGEVHIFLKGKFGNA